MSFLPVEPAANTEWPSCKTCLFRRDAPAGAPTIGMRVCFGVPPTPLGAMTPQGPVVMMHRPGVRDDDPACSLYATDEITAGEYFASVADDDGEGKGEETVN